MSELTPFFTFEGIDGAGKTTQAQRLRDALVALGREVFSSCEPGWEGFGDDVRQLFYRYDGLLTDEARLCLIHAQRHVHLRKHIRPALHDGKVVLCDRFRDSTEAFQIAANSRDDLVDLFALMEAKIVGNDMPTLTFIIDIPVEVARRRMLEREQAMTVYDRRPPEYHERIRQAYLNIGRRDRERCRIIDGDREREDIARDILGYVHDALS